MPLGTLESTVEEIKARIDLAELIGSYGIEIKTAGTSQKACCPFHHEKTPSFHINTNQGYYHCFGCGKSGDAITFVREMEGLSFVEAVKKLAIQVGVEIKETRDPKAARRARLYSLLAELAQFYRRCLLKTKEAELARETLVARELSEEIGESYLIGYAPRGIVPILTWAKKYGYTTQELEDAGVIKGPTRPGDKGYHRFGGRLMFTIRDRQGRAVGFSGRQLIASEKSGKYVNSPETDVFKKSHILYGFDKAAGAIVREAHREAIVCEGQIDCIRLQTSGFPHAVAGQGTAFTEDHVAQLKKVADQVVLVYDDDKAGHAATIKSARLCLSAGLPVRVVSLPGGDDPDSYLRSHEAKEFQNLLDHAESIMSFQVRTERAKEANPDSVDAIQRVTRALLETLARCPGAILRASMIDEVAKLTGLPRVAYTEELSKYKPTEKVPMSAQEEIEESPKTTPVARGKDAAEVLPPNRLEIAFCAFLFAYEERPERSEIADAIGEFLPDYVFGHDFSRNFAYLWCLELREDRDLIAPWSEKLDEVGRRAFDSVMAQREVHDMCGQTAIETLHDFIRILWREYLTRLRGSISLTDDEEVLRKIGKITLDLKRLNSVKWKVVKEIVTDWMGEN